MVSEKLAAPKVVLQIENNKAPEVPGDHPQSPPLPEQVKLETPVVEPPDLLVILCFLFYSLLRVFLF